MKKLTLGVAVAGLTASLGAYAALPTGAAPFQVNVPNLKSGFEFNVTGFYMRPSSSGLDYANVETTTEQADGSTVTNYNSYSVKPKYKPGFSLGLGYVFPNSGNDVQLNWTHLTAKASSSVENTDNAANPPGISGVDASSANANVKFNYNAVDLDAGQYLNLGTRLQMRLFGGLRYANIKRDMSSSFGGHLLEINDPIANLNFDAAEQSRMSGIGPRFGVDTQYHLGNGFGVVAGVSTSLLYSKVKSSGQGDDAISISGTQYIAQVNVPSVSSKHIVPNVDAKLGLNYSYPFGGSVFNVEAGYKVAQYFNAVSDFTVDDGAVERTTSNVSFDGPYLSLSLKV